MGGPLTNIFADWASIVGPYLSIYLKIGVAMWALLTNLFEDWASYVGPFYYYISSLGYQFGYFLLIYFYE